MNTSKKKVSVNFLVMLLTFNILYLILGIKSCHYFVDYYFALIPSIRDKEMVISNIVLVFYTFPFILSFLSTLHCIKSDNKMDVSKYFFRMCVLIFCVSVLVIQNYTSAHIEDLVKSLHEETIKTPTKIDKEITSLKIL